MKLYTLDGHFIEEAHLWPDDFTGFVKQLQGSEIWFMEGKYHKIGGPAYKCSSGSKYWYEHGLYHRIDGPAIEWHDGSKAWYIYGKKVTKEQHKLLYSIMKLKGLI